MTDQPTPHTLSGRPSGRVDLPPPVTPVPSVARPITGNETMAPAGRSSAAAAAAPERRRRVSAGRLASYLAELSTRDHAVLDDIDRYRFLQSRHVRQLHFTSHATADAAERSCRRVLHRLAAQRLIEPLQRRIGGMRAGSESFIWRIGPAGDRLLHATSGTRARRREPSLRFVDHSLAVADCYVAACSLQQSGQLELVSDSPEPDSWRSYLGLGGSSDTLKPDLCLTTASGDYEDRWFIEVDRATESLPTVVGKCRQYERYRRTGREQADTGVFPWVVWVVPDAARVDRIRRAIQASRDLDQQLYRIVTSADLGPLLAGGAL